MKFLLKYSKAPVSTNYKQTYLTRGRYTGIISDTQDLYSIDCTEVSKIIIMKPNKKQFSNIFSTTFIHSEYFPSRLCNFLVYELLPS